MKKRSLVILSTLALFIAAGTIFSLGQPLGHRAAARNECVILLHGLCRSALSMKAIENILRQNGYTVINIDYPSTRKTIASIAEDQVATAVNRCKEQGYRRIHFVTHSMGALIVRRYLQEQQLPRGSRIVMLAPPNQGSELADWAQKNFPRISRLAGPSVDQLTTKPKSGLSPMKPIASEVGIIIGNDSWNPLFSRILPGSDDGKVTVVRAKLEEMRDFWVAPCNHTTILLNREVLGRIVHFLQFGRFWP